MNPLEGKALCQYARAVFSGHADPVKLPSIEARIVVRVLLRSVVRARGDSVKFMGLKEALEAACEMATDAALQEKGVKGSLIEVSVITSSTPIEGVPRPAELEGKGIFIETLDGAGCVLPQEIKEGGFLPKQALNSACQKAGLSFRAWQDPDATLALFTAEVHVD